MIRKRTPVLRELRHGVQRGYSGDEGEGGNRKTRKRKRKRKRGERASEREREGAGKWRLGGHPTPNRRRRHRKARHRPSIIGSCLCECYRSVRRALSKFHRLFLWTAQLAGYAEMSRVEFPNSLITATQVPIRRRSERSVSPVR